MHLLPTDSLGSSPLLCPPHSSPSVLWPCQHVESLDARPLAVPCCGRPSQARKHGAALAAAPRTAHQPKRHTVCMLLHVHPTRPRLLLTCHDQSITSAYSLLSAVQTAHRLSTSITHGLAPSDASARIHNYGPNELPHEEPEPLWLRFIKQFKETLILLLLGSAAVSFIMGNLEDAISIAVAVTIVVTVGFVQEYRSEKSIEALNQLVPHSAHIIRAGVEQPRGGRQLNGSAIEPVEMDNLKDTAASLAAAERKAATISASLLVPGDLVLFHTGDRIPADLRITHAADLSIDESNLTGENEPVSKSPDTITHRPDITRTASPFYASEGAGTVGADIRLNDQKNIAFMGTLVRSGYGQGIVIGTGGQYRVWGYFGFAARD